MDHHNDINLFPWVLGLHNQFNTYIHINGNSHPELHGHDDLLLNCGPSLLTAQSRLLVSQDPIFET
jgi:hypothetical protein